MRDRVDVRAGMRGRTAEMPFGRCICAKKANDDYAYRGQPAGILPIVGAHTPARGRPAKILHLKAMCL